MKNYTDEEIDDRINQLKDQLMVITETILLLKKIRGTKRKKGIPQKILANAGVDIPDPDFPKAGENPMHVSPIRMAEIITKITADGTQGMQRGVWPFPRNKQ